jgi:hypothetical protein
MKPVEANKRRIHSAAFIRVANHAVFDCDYLDILPVLLQTRVDTMRLVCICVSRTLNVIWRV